MFRKRNRLIAGLARATLIVEAGLPSGTFSTADEALAANKDFREALLATGRKRLYNAYALTDPSKTVLTGQEQCRALMRLRKKLKG